MIQQAKESGRVRQSRGSFVAEGAGPLSHSRAVRPLTLAAAARLSAPIDDMIKALGATAGTIRGGRLGL